MNEYIIPVCDLVSADIWNEKIYARSLSECEEKLMQKWSDKKDRDFSDYSEFLDIMDKEYNMAIGSIKDKEEI